MLARYRFLPLLLLLLAASSCSKKTAREQAAATVQTDGDEIDPYSNLVFTFDEKVVDEGKLNHWDTTRFVTFSPNIRGKFKWTGDRELRDDWQLAEIRHSAGGKAGLPGHSRALPRQLDS